MAKLQKSEIASIIDIVALLVFGILFCCSLSMGVEAISWTIGIVLLATALILLIQSYLETKSLTAVNGMLSAFIGAFGVLFIVSKLAWIIVAYIPFILLFIGSYLIIDSILFVTVRGKKQFLAFGIELALGAIALTLGVCLLTIDDFAEYASIVFGVILIVLAVFLLFKLLTTKKATK